MDELEIVWKATVVADGRCLGGTERNHEGPLGSWCSGRVPNGAFPEYKTSELPLRQPSSKLVEIIFRL